MKPQFEPRRRRSADQSFLAFERVEPVFPFAWHYHPELELTWIRSGAGTRFVGDSIEPYGPGDIVLLGSELPHTWSSEERTRRRCAHRAIVVQFSSELFVSQLVQQAEFAAVGDVLVRAGRGVAFSAAAAAAVADDLRALTKERGLTAWCRLARVLDRLARQTEARPLASAGYRPSVQQGEQRRFARALAFVEERLEDPGLYLGDVARAVHLTPAAFSRFFRRMAGRPFIVQVNELRIGRACRQLSDTERSVAEIAYDCGFGNLANFNRRFRAVKGMTPTEFRSGFKGHWIHGWPPHAGPRREPAAARVPG